MSLLRILHATRFVAFVFATSLLFSNRVAQAEATDDECLLRFGETTVLIVKSRKEWMITGTCNKITPRLDESMIQEAMAILSPRMITCNKVFISDSKCGVFRKCTQLRVIRVYGCNCGDRMVEQLADHAGLESVSIYDGHVSDASLEHFQKIRSLKTLSLQRNRFIPLSALKRFQAGLPDVEVFIE